MGMTPYAKATTKGERGEVQMIQSTPHGKGGGGALMRVNGVRIDAIRILSIGCPIRARAMNPYGSWIQVGGGGVPLSLWKLGEPG